LPRAHSLTKASLDRSAPIFAALGDGTRLRLVTRLCEDGPLSITRLAGGFEVSRQAVTKHLKVLEEAGVVRTVWQGRESLWQLEPARLESARRCLDSISMEWDGALGRLQRLVEREEPTPVNSHKDPRR